MSGALADVTVAVQLDGRSYGMFELVELTVAKARVRGPLMLELGEQLAMRFTREGKTVEVDGRITEVARGAGHDDPITTVTLADGGAVAPLLASKPGA